MSVTHTRPVSFEGSYVRRPGSRGGTYSLDLEPEALRVHFLRIQMGQNWLEESVSSTQADRRLSSLPQAG